MTMTTSSFAKSLWPGVNKWYGMEYNEYQVQFTEIFESNTSRRAFEEDVGQSGVGLLSVKAEGAPITYDQGRQGFTSRYNHVTYASGIVITREAVEDDLYDVVGKQKAKGLAFAVRQTKEVLGANVLNRAFSTSYVGGDSSSLVASAGGGGSSTHSNIAGSTWTNGPTAAVDLSESAIEQAVLDIADYTSDRGLKIALKPTKLIIPKELQWEASRILKGEYQVNSAERNINVLKSMGSIPKIVVNNYLTDVDAWFVLTDSKDGLKYFSRRDDEFKTDEDFDTDNAKYKVSFRCSWGWTDARCIWGSPGV